MNKFYTSLRFLVGFLFLIILKGDLNGQCSSFPNPYRDNGGVGNYFDYSNQPITINADPGKQVVLNFSEFVTEQGYDTLIIYNGTGTNKNLVGKFHGNLTSTLPGPFTSTKGGFYLEFKSDGTVNHAGFTFTATCLTVAIPEICTNGVDDDLDGFIDALDTDCNTCSFVGQNLVINGEFDSGNTGFTSDYTNFPLSNMASNYGIYGVGNRVSQVGNPIGVNLAIWSAADRANNGGNFMLIDPSAVTGTNDRIWAQSIPVCPNTNYVFSIWTKNMYYAEAGGYSGIDPNFQFKINGTTLPGADFTMPRQPRADSLKWIKVQGTWNSGSSTSAVLNVVNNVPGTAGNDLAIDGIFFGMCGKTVAINSSKNTICAGGSQALLSTTNTTSSGWSYYEWFKDGLLISGSNSPNYTATSPGTYVLKAYTTLNNSGCPQVSNSLTLTSAPVSSVNIPDATKAICSGGSFTMNPVVSGTNPMSYSWTPAIGLSNSTIATPVATPSSDTKYILNVTDGNGCVVKDSISFVLNSSVSGGTISGYESSCTTFNPQLISSSVSASGSSSINYQWQSSPSAGTWYDIVGATSETYDPPANITVTTFYRRLAKDASCTSYSGISNVVVKQIQDCNTCTPPLFVFENHTLESGSNLAVGSVYKFKSVIPDVDGYLTYVSRSHNDIEVINIDVPERVYGGYDAAIQPVIDYNYVNADGTFDPAGSKSIQFKMNFKKANTNIDTILPLFSMTAIDIDGTGSSSMVNETFQNSGYLSYGKNPTSLITTSGALLATGSNNVYLGIDENAFDAMISFNHINKNEITFNYGSTYGGAVISDNIDPRSSAERRMNSLYFRCYDLPIVACTSTPNAPTVSGGSRCGAGTVSLSASSTNQFASLKWYTSAMGGSPVFIGNNYSPSISTTQTYYVETFLGGCTSSRVAVTATIINQFNPGTISGIQESCISFKPSLITGSIPDGCTGGTPIYSWEKRTSGSWSTIIGATSKDYSPESITITTIYRRGVKPLNGVVTYSNEITKTVLPPINVTIDSTGAICLVPVSTLQASSTGGTGLRNYTWSGPGIITPPNTAMINLSAAGNYSVTVTDSKLCSDTKIYTVAPLPIVNITGPTNICKDGQSSVTSNLFGGTWTSSNPSVASINPSNGIINGIAPGSATFTYTSSKGCVSAPSSPITITNKNQKTITGNNNLCEGTTSQLSINGITGNWSVLNSSIASINSAGLVTAIAPGVTTVQYTSGLGSCDENSTYSIIVNSNPIVTVTGSKVICAAETTTLGSSISNGLWSTSNSNVATIDPSTGVVTGVSGGVANFIFTTNGSLCTNKNPDSAQVTVNSLPIVSLNGNDKICIGSSTSVTSNLIGTWQSLNPTIASISNGTITALSEGEASIRLVANGTNCSAMLPTTIKVGTPPILDINTLGATCLSSNKVLTAAVAGGNSPFSFSWTGPVTSTNQSITVNTIGAYNLVVQSSYGCIVNKSITIIPPYNPSINLPTNTVCQGTQIQLNTSETSFGATYQWGANTGNSTSSMINIVPVGPSTNYSVTVTNNIGCVGSTNATVVVNANPITTLIGGDSICPKGMTQFTASGSGFWFSGDPSVATITNSGYVTAQRQGMVKFRFRNSSTNCVSDSTQSIIVKPAPNLAINGPDIICQQDTVRLTSSLSGSWVALNPSNATISNSGLVTANNAGLANFNFMSNSGCSAESDLTVMINTKPVTSFIGPKTLCLNETSQLIPNNGGNWISENPDIASINSAGIVTANNSGATKFFFISSEGCKSEVSDTLRVHLIPKIDLNGQDSICQGSTTLLTSTSSGQWISLDNSIAIISHSGTITGIGSGIATFKFTANNNNCSVNSNNFPITVLDRPSTQLIGSNATCINNSSSFLPNSGGMWTSSNTNVATINNQGMVNAVSPGTATFTFKNLNTTCNSLPTTPFTVYAKPIVNVSGPSTICVGSTTNLSPSSGGYWKSSDESIASVNSYGEVIGKKIGKAKFVFSELNSECVSDSLEIEISTTIGVDVLGPSVLCVNEQTTLSPSTGGYWLSSNPTAAIVNNIGIVTAVSQGSAVFTFTTNNGCISLPTAPIIVNDYPTIIISTDQSLCIGETASISPASGGTWESDNPSVATINNSGLITAVSAGTVHFTYTDASTGCISSKSTTFIVNPKPIILPLGNTSMCKGNTLQLSPFNVGIWGYNNENIITVSGNGLVYAKNTGISKVAYTNTTTFCSSDSIEIRVMQEPNFSVKNTLCIGDTVQVNAGLGGVWVSNNPNIATISPNGLITAVSPGVSYFAFILNATGCKVEVKSGVRVLDPVKIGISSEPIACSNNTNVSKLSTSSLGIWTSLTPNIAEIELNEIVKPKTAGQAKFVFTENSHGCKTELLFNVNSSNILPPDYLGQGKICLGYNEAIRPSSGVIWTSTNPDVASIANNGVITTLAPGRVNFYYYDILSGCTSDTLPNPIYVVNCIDPDFNVTSKNKRVFGNLATNDDIIETFIRANNNQRNTNISYSNAILISKPIGSNPQMIISQDGKYNFNADVEGKYVYGVPVCINDAQLGCPLSLLELSVIDNTKIATKIITNVDIATLYSGSTITMNSISNDRVIGTAPGLKMKWVKAPRKGTPGLSTIEVGVSSFGASSSNFGLDTMIYSLDEDPVQTNYQTRQYITINTPSALNSVVGADDFDYTYSGGSVVINLLKNDSDPENDQITIQQVGSFNSPVAIPQGKYRINDAGRLFFEAAPGFTGPLDIIYTICDNNASSSCTKATAHILVLEDVTIQARVYLEGALINNGNALSSTGKPLMRDDLRKRNSNGVSTIPLNDPYSNIMGPQFDIRKYYPKINQDSTRSAVLVDPTVFDVTGENAIVDWVFVELRSKSDIKQAIATRSGLVQRDGDVVDLDGVSPMKFSNLGVDSVYVFVKHRNHLGVISTVVPVGVLVDFTNPNVPVFDFGTTLNNGLNYSGLAMNRLTKPGYRALWAGDLNSSGKIGFSGSEDDLNIILDDVLNDNDNQNINANFDFSLGYLQGDFDLNGKSKFDNPNDDKNYLFGQVILYPLNFQSAANFGELNQQVPKRN
jgi:uncharacterized protein YjdB